MEPSPFPAQAGHAHMNLAAGDDQLIHLEFLGRLRFLRLSRFLGLGGPSPRRRGLLHVREDLAQVVMSQVGFEVISGP